MQDDLLHTKYLEDSRARGKAPQTCLSRGLCGRPRGQQQGTGICNCQFIDELEAP